MEFLPDRQRVVLRYLLEKNALEFPQRECMLFENGERWTYQEALQEAYKSANALSRMGIQRGGNVLIFLPNNQSWIRAWWGIAFLGAVIVPVNTAYKGEMLRHICLDSLASHIITCGDLAERVKDLRLELEIVDPIILPEGGSHEPTLDMAIEPWDIHQILYTSGTTGPSKGAVKPYLVTYSETNVMWGERATGDDTMLVDYPLFHSGGLANSYAMLIVGGRVALRTVFSASRYWDIVRECAATMTLLIGTSSAFLVKAAPRTNDADNPLRVALITPMVSDPDSFMARFGIDELFMVFGMTETGNIFMTRGPIVNPKACGSLRPGVEVRIVDDHDIPVPPGEIGELIVRTYLPWDMSLGYWQRPEDTVMAWRNGWFHTGDFFVYDEEGNYFFIDRKKDAVRRRGENISSFEVEREVMCYPDVLEAACIAAPSEYGEDEVKVFVVPREGSNFDPVELIKFLIPRMPYFMVPRFVEVVPGLPRTPSMRVKKYELRGLGNTATTWDREAAGIVVGRNS